MTLAWWFKCTKQVSIAKLLLLSCWAGLRLQCQKQYTIGDPKCLVIQHLVVHNFTMTVTHIQHRCQGQWAGAMGLTEKRCLHWIMRCRINPKLSTSAMSSSICCTACSTHRHIQHIINISHACKPQQISQYSKTLRACQGSAQQHQVDKDTLDCSIAEQLATNKAKSASNRQKCQTTVTDHRQSSAVAAFARLVTTAM